MLYCFPHAADIGDAAIKTGPIASRTQTLRERFPSSGTTLAGAALGASLS
jgi:hypothetical protein